MATQILGKVGVVPKGEYDGLTQYKKLDIVTYNGQSYIAKQDSQGNAPTNILYWQLLAEKGVDGQDGYTPVKGVDYYTVAEQAEIENNIRQILESEIPDVSNFITASVDNLINYYLKSETYNKTEVDGLIRAVKTGIFQSVSVLPVASIDTMNIIYLVPSTDPKTQNIKEEYITIEDSGTYKWEHIGSTAISLAGYATETWVNAQISDFLTDTEIQQLINTAVNAKYTKPLTGIPKSDLTSDVQTSLGLADTALQTHQDISGKMDKANMVVLTQLEYDSLPVKDANTFYFIIEE